jgi:endonuclease V-like protein UPF0215 family
MKLQCFLLFICLFFLVEKSEAQRALTNLPTLYIETINSQTINREYIEGTLRISTSSGQYATQNMELQIRGRGNSTWNFAKKPYRIKLNEEAQLLGMPAKNRDWVLLANHADKTLIRNAVAFKISEWMKFEYTPAFRFVDVVLNGDYIGNYMLTDQLEVAKNRVPVEKQDDDAVSLPEISGGYLLELDGFATREAVWFETSKRIKVSLKYPDDDELNTQQLQYIKNHLQLFEDALFSENYRDPKTGYRAYTDSTTLIDWYIASELTGNPDCFWSTYVYKRRNNDRIFWGPLWDYDIAFNNDNRLGDATYRLMRTAAHNPKTWINRLWTDDWFQRSVKARWKELLSEGIEDSIQQYIDRTVEELTLSQKLNFEQWDVLSSRVYLEWGLFSTYDGYVEFLKDYVSERVDFLSQNMVVIPTAPFVPENYYYTIANAKTGSVLDIDEEERGLVNLWEVLEDRYRQHWEIVPVGNENYRFVNRSTNEAISDAGKGMRLEVVPHDSLDQRQQWTIVPVGYNDTYGIVNTHSGFVFDNVAGDTANGAEVISYINMSNNSLDQQWVFQRGEEITGFNAIDDRSVSASLHIYPNPVHDLLHFRASESELSSARMTLFDLSGRQVLQQSGLQNSVNVSGLKPGIYLLKINTPQAEKIIRLIRN